MLPHKFVWGSPLAATDIRVYAANGTMNPVLGKITLRFEVTGVPVHCQFLVYDAVDEPMLGIDWLEANDCKWNFSSGTIFLAEKEILLCGRPRKPAVRRVYVQEKYQFLPGHKLMYPLD